MDKYISIMILLLLLLLLLWYFIPRGLEINKV